MDGNSGYNRGRNIYYQKEKDKPKGWSLSIFPRQIKKQSSE
jgi:hypothetical protein